MNVLVFIIFIQLYCKFINGFNYKFTKKYYKLNNLKNSFEFNEFDRTKETYTIIAVDNKNTENLINFIKKNKVNYVYININELSLDELYDIKKHHRIDIDTSKYPIIFKNLDEYIGSTLEIYKLIITKH